ncbi:flagellar hook-associated family protein [Microvirga solisilvae]|uniref:flagellar hook-associated family protein n=1 Tax=Microvirga solisilvae TaxID=2919498 RepID=UPI001FAF91E1|nr:flagellar hook-associated family protein [Microvirga solisilvae]
MKTTFISSSTLWNSPRATLDKLQSEIVKANKEVVTGRHADVGLALGRTTGKSLSLRQERATLDALTDSNTTATLRLKSTAATLDQVRASANTFRDSLIGVRVGVQDVPLIKGQAKAALDKLISAANENIGGQYVFGGINSKVKPLNAYEFAAKADIDEAFLTHFTFPQSDAAQVAEITPDEMKAFIEGPLADLFENQWKGTWSEASDKNIQNLISPTERVETSANVNETAFRQLAMGYVMTFDLGIENLNDGAREYLLNSVIGTLGNGINEITQVQADLGTAQQKIDEANERMSFQKNFFEERVTNYEAVDPAEAKVRVDQLATQIQTSYSLTAQLNQLSLIKFI